MITINSTTDIRTWLDNAGLLEHLTAEETDRVVELLADAEGRPAYGEDWEEYLDARAQALVFEVATASEYELYDYETGDYIRPATVEEYEASVAAAEIDGGAGAIRIDGRRVFAR